MMADTNTALRVALTSAMQALRSYQFSNAAPGLAKDVADHCETILSLSDAASVSPAPLPAALEKYGRHLGSCASIEADRNRCDCGLEQAIRIANLFIIEVRDPVTDVVSTDARTGLILNQIATERLRQITDEGWSATHDDGAVGGELSRAAACYAVGEIIHGQTVKGPPFAATIRHWTLWPWHYATWKPKNQRRNLIRAAALIVAELERLDRAEAKVTGAGQ